jgi:type IV secretion system protein VirD4
MSSENAILLGKSDNGKPIYSEGYQHILLLAPHGSGKGVCFVLPTLLSLKKSCIVHDIKLENYTLTSGYRASIGHKIFVWNPLGAKNKTHRYNPLDFISEDPEKIVNDISRISDLLIINNSSSKILFTALVLYLCVEPAKTRSLGQVARMLQMDLIKELSDGIDVVKDSIHHFGYQNIQCFLKKDIEEQRTIIQDLSNYLYPWTNPLIDYATSYSDFDIAALKTSKVTIYVGINPSDIDRLQPVMQLFYNHAAQVLMATAQNLGENENSGVCLFMDEFTSIGKLNVFASCLPYFRGYKIKLFLISSDIGKIESIYGKNATRSIISDCTFKVAFAANDSKSANQISSICLDRKENVELMSWQQIMNLPSDSQIILIDKEEPIVSKKVFYYEDEAMKNKIITPTPL